jgi:hypothetical protein
VRGGQGGAMGTQTGEEATPERPRTEAVRLEDV